MLTFKQYLKESIQYALYEKGDGGGAGAGGAGAGAGQKGRTPELMYNQPGISQPIPHDQGNPYTPYIKYKPFQLFPDDATCCKYGWECCSAFQPQPSPIRGHPPSW